MCAFFLRHFVLGEPPTGTTKNGGFCCFAVYRSNIAQTRANNHSPLRAPSKTMGSVVLPSAGRISPSAPVCSICSFFHPLFFQAKGNVFSF